jgi:hypothetical protein
VRPVSDTTTTRYAQDTPRSITYVRLDQLKPAPENPRVHDLEVITDSIARHGFTVPILVCERREQIAAGHGRWKSLLSLYQAGEPTPAGILLDDDAMWLVPILRGWSSRNDAEFKQYLVNDTKTAQSGGWDDRALAAILEELTTNEPILFEELAFDAQAMDDLLRTVDPTRLVEADPDAPIPAGQGVGTNPADDPRPTREAGELAPDGPGDASAGKKITCPSCHARFQPGDQQFKSGSRARSGD